MYLKRQKAIIKLPIERKGTKYIARAASNLNNSIPVVIAIRDMLKLAKTSGEVKKMINQKIIKINGKPVKDLKESIQLFGLLEAGKTYVLSLLPTGKFVFEEAKEKNIRVCKIINRTLVKGNNLQLNLHDGTNILSKDKITIGDSIHLDLSGKIKKHIPLEKGKEVMILSGKYAGLRGKIYSLEGKKASIIINEKKAVLETSRSLSKKSDLDGAQELKVLDNSRLIAQ